MPGNDIRSSLLSRHDPGKPFVTHLGIDGRVELSGTTVANAAAKIANALNLHFDLQPGDTVGIHVPWHWQRVAWLLGIWCAGCTAVPGGGEECDLIVAGPREARGLPGSVHVVSTHPFGMPLDAAALAQLPPGIEDVTLAVRAQPDQQLFIADHRDQIALDDLSQAQLLQRGTSFAAGLPGAFRLGIDQGDDQWWLPAVWPLVTDGSVVLADATQEGSFIDEALDARV